MLVHALFEESARRAPHEVALIEAPRSVTYEELDRLANRFAHLFRRAGAVRGDRVLIALDNCVEFVGAYLGAMKAGAAAVPLAGGPRNDRLVKAVADCGPRVCVVDAAGAEALSQAADVPPVYVLRPAPGAGPDLAAALAAELDTDPAVRQVDRDLAAIIYTSGSTGDPRGVMLTHRNLVSNARSIVQYLGLTARDRVMCVLPFHYVYGLSLLHTHLLAGGSLVIDNRFAFPNVVLGAMREHRVTGFAGVPSTFALLLHRSSLAQTPLPDLRYVTQAGGAMSAQRILEWRERGPGVPLYVMYGATEASARLAYLDPADLPRKIGSIGRAIPNVEIVVMKEDGTRAAAGEVGELVARGSNISCGYWNDPEETSRRFGPQGYRTGDLGYTDEEGFIFLVGRSGDMIKVGAHRVGPKEIEDVLQEHPAVHEAAVVGVPHPILGEAPAAVVALRDHEQASPEMLRAFCQSRLPAHKVPVRFLFRPDLPKLGQVGKIDRQQLRQALAAEADEVP